MKQVKVTKTETYKDSQDEHIVCKGKLVLINIHPDNYEMGVLSTKKGKLFKPIIISETEEIEVGDKRAYANPYYNGEYEIVEDSNTNNREYVKILALPENFSPKHLQAIIDGKLKDGDEVYIKVGSEIGNTGYNVLRYNSNNHIKLFPINKEETWNNISSKYFETHCDELDLFKYLQDNYLPPKRK